MNGRTLTKEEIEFLIESNAIEGEYRNIALGDAKDAWNYATSLKFKSPYNMSINQMLKIHKILMKRISPNIAGKLRKQPVFVGSNSKGIRECIDYKKILSELMMLFNAGLNPYYLGEEQIKNFHIKFEEIHPFLDGNGRTGRIIMNIQRLKLGLPLLIIHTGKEQQEYYKWFEELK